MERQQKTSRELEAMVMAEVRAHRELNDILGVIIRRAQRLTPETPNWDAVFNMPGTDASGRPIPMPIPHPLAYELVRKLQACFDLV
jgi:hypothetical protein